jgi:hypothetical protein
MKGHTPPLLNEDALPPPLTHAFNGAFIKKFLSFLAGKKPDFRQNEKPFFARRRRLAGERRRASQGSGFKEPIPRAIVQPAFANLAAYVLFADYIHGASVIPFDSFFKKGFKPPSPFIKVCFKLAQDGILWHAVSTAMRQVVSPDTLRLKPEGTSFREPTSLPIVPHLTGGTPYSFLGFYTINCETHPNLPSDSTYLAGLKRLGEALQDGMGRFAMTISSTFGHQASSAAVVYIWLSFYLRRSIPLQLDASASPAVISLHSAVMGKKHGLAVPPLSRARTAFMPVCKNSLT